MFGVSKEVMAHLVLGFALHQLADFGADYNWDEAPEDFDDWLEELLPYARVDKVIEAVANPTIAAIGHALKDKAETSAIADAAASEDWTVAGAGLVKLLHAVAPNEVKALLPAAA